MTTTRTPETEQVLTFEQPDGYRTHYRVWGPAQADDVVVMLHGGMSHSGWQAPLGTRLGQLPGTAFVAVDFRGSGLNDGRGHIPAGQLAVDDIAHLLRHLKDSYGRIHLAGWCFGAQIATVVATGLAGQEVISSLIMTSPGFFFNDRYNDVLDRSIDAALIAAEELGLTPEPDRAFIQIPLRTPDFTDRPEWHAFIDADELRLLRITVGTIDAWEEIAVRSEKDFAGIGPLPLLAVFGTRDKLVDNARVRAFLATHPDLRVHELDTGHALQFEEPDALAALLGDFIGHPVAG
ncbi:MULTISPECIES: alpha/beta fold hydrolase [unclassified Streptomyces]|uniref:alpha/beta fold hydrolase n=1 Tax=Streptomycetaceae TaxID=2062 RepID=UPI002E7777EC|nr:MULTISPECIES: alpha/beta fold hydrolase [unclassified Streptomyces]MED7952758.1 alpha/beta fold hydrolase [Streptomyces sp. BE303]MEE1825649.1 alpha/beta fold hydrolase [Streptomyces sp. BE20]